MRYESRYESERCRLLSEPVERRAHSQELTAASRLGPCGGFEIQKWIIKAWPNADTHLAVGDALVDT